jgi:hypothetical protein
MLLNLTGIPDQHLPAIIYPDDWELCRQNNPGMPTEMKSQYEFEYRIMHKNGQRGLGKRKW